MRTIYDKLKPDLRAKILKNAKKYPNATERLIEVLKSKQYYSELTIRQVQSLSSFTGVWFYECKPLDLIYGDAFVTE
jgi:hypothetical protein